MSADFVAHMEDVLELYAEPYDPQRPVVCFDETSTQLLADARPPIPAAPGQPRREDYEYRRQGTCNLFLACEPLAGWRQVAVTERRTMQDFAQQMRWLASSWSVQFVCPSGALLHAMATRCASCLPLSLRSRPDRGRSLIAASSPSSTNRLRTLATVAALSETASATSRSASPSSAFNSARARFTVRANGLPRPDVSIRAERSDWVSSTLYLDGQAYPGTGSQSKGLFT